MSIITRSIHNNTIGNITLQVPGYDTVKPPVVIPASTTVDLFTVLTGDELEAIQPLLRQYVLSNEFTVTATVDTATFSPVGGSGGSGITALTGDVTASGTGSVVATVATVGGSSASNIHLVTAQVLEGPSNVLYVNQNQPGVTTPTGSIFRPFIHIQDAVNQIIANNDGLSYIIIVAPGSYAETITLNDPALTRLAFATMNVNNGGLSNDALANTTLTGDIVSTTNNAHLKSLTFRGFDLQGNINLSGDIDGTTFGQYLILFSDMILYSTGATAINLNNVGQVVFENCGSAIQSGAGAISIQNAGFCGIYNSFFNFGNASIITNAGINKPSGFSSTSVNASFSNFLDNTTIDAQSILTVRFTRFNGTINNSGSLTSFNSVFNAVVTNSGTWNSSGDPLNATPVNTGTITNHSTLYSAFAYKPAISANWTSQPTTVAQALDMIAAKIGPI